MQSNQSHFIDVAQLQVGLYIHLDLGWMDHPFTLSNFKLKDEEQISKIKKIGLKKLRYDPKRSDCAPLPVTTATPVAATTSATEANSTTEAIARDKALAIPSKTERLIQLQQAIDENETKFVIASDVTRQITHNILTEPQTSIEQATLMVNDMVDTALMEGDVAIHALNGNQSSDKNYQHPLNVTVLALMMAKSIEMSKEDVRLLGMAALFHDIGKAEIADHILTKKEPLTKSEQLHYEQHSEIGARMAQEVGLPVRVGKIILQHHEHADGTGFPNRLNNEQTDPLARLVALANGYDNLCNPNNHALAKTPYEALAHMYAHQRTKFDESLLKHLIKSLGIYPPGSIVQLSTGVHAIVISANPHKPLRPYVMLHDPLADRKAPRILDLRQELNINISACIRANQLPPDVRSYLNPRNKISYFMDTELSKNEDGLN
ncbi:MAG: HD domain-containing phosphohydrolase [Methylotenera sp.]